MSGRSRLARTLRAHHKKLTDGRWRVYETLAAANQPLSNTQIIARLADRDRVSIYRTLHLFESIGVTHRVWNGFKSAVELSEAFSPHHHHFTCVACARVTSLGSERIEQALAETASGLGVSITSHVIELNGVCRDCQRGHSS